MEVGEVRTEYKVQNSARSSGITRKHKKKKILGTGEGKDPRQDEEEKRDRTGRNVNINLSQLCWILLKSNRMYEDFFSVSRDCLNLTS